MFKDLRREIKEWREDRRLEAKRALEIRKAIEHFHKTGLKLYKKKDQEWDQSSSSASEPSVLPPSEPCS